MVVQKRRFILFEVLLSGSSSRAVTLAQEDVARAVREAMEGDWGLFGEAQAQLRLIYWSPTVQLGVLRCARPAAERLCSALALMSAVRGVPLQIRVHDRGGTLRSVQRTGEELLQRWCSRAAARTASTQELEAVKQGFETEMKLLAEVKAGWLAAFAGE
eukprot:TRINITY_DN47113_c0_g1_i1.p1 TRINITY_DN47113_c0_g1~~TRINITY_DN47113_c0_g1_i1.p1  ORF type:complete len:159 (+),score=41.18 TRINITY_DN47113_c0_g1_i1:60-536(+)